MNRRGFLGLLGASLAGYALDPEFALWVPGKKTILLPPVTRLAPFRVGELVSTLNGSDWSLLTETAVGPVGVWDGSRVVTQGSTQGLFLAHPWVNGDGAVYGAIATQST